ncbi:MAG: alpha/beta fold hydrolase [Acidobacteria bacterium]|nr:alpha/beta fold hydrolase [Acidobacteriota bacterium]
MKRILIELAFPLMLLLLFASLASSKDSLDWAGAATPAKGNPVFIKLRFESTKAGANGFFHSTGWRIIGRRFSQVSFDGHKLHFEFPSQEPGKTYMGEGQLKDGVISGKIQSGEDQSSFHLVRLPQIPSKILESYVGAYQLTPDRVVLITWGAFGHLRLVDLKAGSKDFLLPLTEATFFTGVAVTASPNIRDTVTFIRDESGVVKAMTFRVGGRELSAPKIDLYKQELVTFRNDKVTLSGVLITPSTKGPHPAVVYIEGSGDRTRDDACCGNVEVRSLLARGVAFLLYDKRGTGSSGGDWHTSSFQDLATDALAGVRLLKQRRDINPRQIGLIGSSQGGWIAPLAASQSKDVAFVVSISAAGVPVAEQEKYDQINRLRTQGQSEDVLKKADAFLDLQFDAVRSRAGWERLQAALPEARGQIWASRSFAWYPKEHWMWAFWRKIVDYDPALVLEKVRIPVLLIIGERDAGQPVHKGVERIESAFKAGKNRDYKIEVISNADHSLQVLDENNRLAAATGIDTLITDWVLRRVTVAK